MRWSAWVLVGVLGCGAPEAANPTNPSNPLAPPSSNLSHETTPGITLAWSPNNRKIDKIGETDGAMKPDGKKDVVLVAEFDGPATALFVVHVTASGEPTGDFQADTLTGTQKQPIELSLGGEHGQHSAGLVAFEGTTLLNATDGSLKPLGSGRHKLTLHLVDNPAISDGIRLYIAHPDGTLKRSAILR